MLSVFYLKMIDKKKIPPRTRVMKKYIKTALFFNGNFLFVLESGSIKIKSWIRFRIQIK